MIRLEDLHPGIIEYTFKYAEISDIYNRSEPVRHCILVRKRKGKPGAWEVAGNSAGPFNWGSRAAAMAELKRLKAYVKELRSATS
jgi:hypothetical protein